MVGSLKKKGSSEKNQRILETGCRCQLIKAFYIEYLQEISGL